MLIISLLIMRYFWRQGTWHVFWQLAASLNGTSKHSSSGDR
jgi:hypothetical protein